MSVQVKESDSTKLVEAAESVILINEELKRLTRRRQDSANEERRKRLLRMLHKQLGEIVELID